MLGLVAGSETKPHRSLRPRSAGAAEIVMTIASPLAMWANSWARTASNSFSSRRSTRPLVTMMIAFLAFLPAENALGTSVGMTASRGTGTSAIAQSRSRIGWRRIVSGPPSRSALASERARSSERYGAHASRPSAPRATRTATIPPQMKKPHGDKPEEEREVQGSEQHKRERHAEGEPRVPSKRSTFHSRDLVLYGLPP
jgi:hypothetical protein